MDINRKIIEEFRVNGGRVGGMFKDGRLLHLEELRLVCEYGDGASLLTEVERLTKALPSHLDHEEETVVPLLDAIAP